VFFERKGSLFIGRFHRWFDAPGLVHGFSTRVGGASAPPYDSLNLGRNTDDLPESVRENLARFCRAAGIGAERIAYTKQVHGDAVGVVCGPGVHDETDALVTDAPGLALSVQVADCVPVFLFDPVRRAVGIAHAGWKGSALGIAGATVRRMAEAFGSRPGNLQAGIGPSIGPCCYEVGPEVAERFPAAYLNGNKLDLWRYNEDLLIRSGVPAGAVHVSRLCTCCQAVWFFSHRGSGGKTGRMLGIIGIKGAE
jgi:polyphenol oxidase